MQEITTPHFWSALNYNFLPEILTQEINYTKILLLHILEASVGFIKSISPAFSLGHISRFGKKRMVSSFSLPHLSQPSLCLFALFSPHSPSLARALTRAVTHLLFPSHRLLLSLSLLLIFTSLLSLPFPSPFSYLTLSEFSSVKFVVLYENEMQIINLQSGIEVSEPIKITV